MAMNQSSFLSPKDRRELLIKLFPDIKIKSLSTIDGVIDDKHFIKVG
jgi:hypothetical protein